MLLNEIKNVELLTDKINYEIRNTIISNALDLMSDDMTIYLPQQKQIAIQLSILKNCFLFTNKDGLGIDIFDCGFTNDDFYELCYMFNYDVLFTPMLKCQIKDILLDIDNIIEIRLLNTQIDNNRTSKYDEVLDQILDFIDKYKNIFDNVNMEKYLKDVSMLSRKLKDVSEEDVVKNIVKLLHDNPVEKDEVNVVDKKDNKGIN